MKTKHLFFIALFFVLLINLAKAQHGNVWVYGIGNTLDFNQSPPVDAPQRPMQAFEGSAVACDSLGNLLFYTNGITVYDKNDQIMPNGDSLKGGTSALLGRLILSLSKKGQGVQTPFGRQFINMSSLKPTTSSLGHYA